MKKFVVLAVPRTGSNFLCTLLNSHTRVLCHHEVFNPDGIYYAVDKRDGSIDLGSLADRDRDPIGFLERVWQTGHDQECVGFKWTRPQNEVVFDHVLHDRQVRKIILRRNNRIKVYVSEQIAKQTGQWEVYRQHDLVRRRPRIRVDLARLQDHAAANEAFYSRLERTLSQADQPWLGVRYEDLLSNSQQSRLLDFLEIDQQPLQAASVKQNPSDLRELIDNFTELAAAVAHTDFEAELHDRSI